MISLIHIDEKNPILSDESPILRQVSAEVTEFGDDLHRLIAKMIAVMEQRRGAGLAAIQIGVPLRVIITHDEGEARWFINPVITRRLNRFDVANEGCLSVPPSRWRPVSRPAKCELEWRDAHGGYHSGGFRGMMARIIQHEVDHLDGILITDKVAA